MSRFLMLGILGILLVLLGVMARLVNPTKTEPTPAEQAQVKEEAQAVQKKASAAEGRQRKEMMQQMYKQRDEAKKRAGVAGVGNRPELGKPSKPAPSTSMEITSDWFHTQQSGKAGLKDLEAVRREAEEYARRSQQNIQIKKLEEPK